MVEQDVAGGDGLEHVALLLEAERQAGGEARVLEVGTVHQVGEAHQPVQVDRPVHPVEVRGLEVEAPEEEVGHLLRAGVVDLQTYRVPVAARGQLPLQGAQQVVHLLFVDEEVAVAGHPELVALGHLHAGEEVADVGVHHRGQEHEVVGTARHRFGQADEPGQGTRRLHHRHAAFLAEGVLALQEDDEVQALVVDPREGVRRVQADGTHDGQDLGLEVGANPLLLRRPPATAPEEADPLALQRRQHLLVEQGVLVGDQPVGDGADPRQRLGGAQVVGAGLHRAVIHLLHEAAHPHLEELVQVRARDAQEAQAFEQRGVRVARLLQHPAVEGQQADLAVDVEVGVFEVGGIHEDATAGLLSPAFAKHARLRASEPRTVAGTAS